MIAGPAPTSWRPTEEESASWARTLLEVAAIAAGAVVAPAAPFLLAGGMYLYRRRHLLFRSDGNPRRAVNFAGQSLHIDDPRRPINAIPLMAWLDPQRQVISLSAELTPAARKAGLRHGDPVAIVLASQVATSTQDGLIVPARMGDQVELMVPYGQYSVMGLGAPTTSLFVARDPIRAVAAAHVVAGAQQRLLLPMTTRSSVQASSSRAPAVLPCWFCGKTVFHQPLHAIVCPKRPRPFACTQCHSRFFTEEQLKQHGVERHPVRISSAGIVAALGQATGRQAPAQPCQWCGRKFPELGHRFVCPLRPRTLACTQCASRFFTQEQLKQHRARRHGPFRLSSRTVGTAAGKATAQPCQWCGKKVPELLHVLYCPKRPWQK